MRSNLHHPSLSLNYPSARNVRTRLLCRCWRYRSFSLFCGPVSPRRWEQEGVRQPANTGAAVWAEGAANLTLLGEHRWSVLTSAWIECLIGSDDRLSSSVPYISCGIDRSDPPGILKFLLVYSRYKTVPTNLTICRQKHKYSNPPLSKLVL